MGNTSVAKLTNQQFNEQADQLFLQSQEQENHFPQLQIQDPDFKCTHVFEEKEPMFALGFCKECFMQMLKVTPDFTLGSRDPPCYLRGIKKLKKQRLIEQQLADTREESKKDKLELLDNLQDLEALSQQFEPPIDTVSLGQKQQEAASQQTQEQEEIADEEMEDPGIKEGGSVADEESALISSQIETETQDSQQIGQSQVMVESQSSLGQDDGQGFVGESQVPDETQVQLLSQQQLKLKEQDDKLQTETSQKSDGDDEEEDSFDFGDGEELASSIGEKRKQIQIRDASDGEDSDAFEIEIPDEGPPDNFSDVSDVEEYIASPEEIESKRVYWENEFRDWEIEQSLKEKAKQNKLKAERTKRPRKDSTRGPAPDTTKEAVEEFLKEKSFSKRINYDVFDELFKDTGETPKTAQAALDSVKYSDKEKDEEKSAFEDLDFTAMGIGNF
eukprot:TRINITY_DN35662_c0_g2_i1.p1 TRINITY_DN35662_c0_g2~~TRINITY_DN35662_c0_g2_i1.p1  ORF type:complete len:460 (-),score=103.62 TRINITY_DN35662_c0_g2_i1:80-1414(-)